jgi:hypothetical protein
VLIAASSLKDKAQLLDRMKEGAAGAGAGAAGRGADPAGAGQAEVAVKQSRRS